ncbi:MAG TPA: acyltransferase [Chitinophagaceae bacterium]|nr:acyltransferase [Chitinophagaceae bacterium]
MFSIAGKTAAVAAPAKPAASDKIAWVYHARGIAIMLIVYRHIVLGMQASGVEVSQAMYNLQIIFFNFRMPAFFILSGVFIARSLKRKSRTTVAWNKVSNLLYPYLLWAIITLALQLAFSSFSNAHRSWRSFLAIITQPRALDQLWYLFALFNVSLLYLLLSRLPKRFAWVHILVAFGLHFLSFYLQDYSLFSDFFYFYLFFLAGALISDFLLQTESRTKLFQTANLLWLLPLFAIGQWFWFTQVGQWYWINKEHLEPNNGHTGAMEFLFILINLIGCYMLFMVANSIAKSNRNEWLAYIGRYSLYVYILHVQVAAIIRKLVRGAYHGIDPWLLLAICFICGIVVPILLVNGFRKYGIERLFTLQRSKEA